MVCDAKWFESWPGVSGRCECGFGGVIPQVGDDRFDCALEVGDGGSDEWFLVVVVSSSCDTECCEFYPRGARAFCACNLPFHGGKEDPHLGVGGVVVFELWVCGRQLLHGDVEVGLCVVASVL